MRWGEYDVRSRPMSMSMRMRCGVYEATSVWCEKCTGAWELGGGGSCPPTFCLNGMDMPVPPPLNFGNH